MDFCLPFLSNSTASKAAYDSEGAEWKIMEQNTSFQLIPIWSSNTTAPGHSILSCNQYGSQLLALLTSQIRVFLALG